MTSGISRDGGRFLPINEEPSCMIQPSNESALEGVSALVVDDDFDTLEALAAMLRMQGAKVLAVTSATDALRALATLRPDVLVVDLMMPEASGYELIRRVRELPAERGGNTPAVAVTGFASQDVQEETATAGFQLHLTKPIAAEDLAEAVRSLRASKVV